MKEYFYREKKVIKKISKYIEKNVDIQKYIEGKGSEKLDLWGILGYFQALVRFIIGPDAFVIPAPVFTRVNSGGNPCFSEL